MSRNGTEFQKENITPKICLQLLEQSIILCPNKGNYPIGFCFIKKKKKTGFHTYVSIHVNIHMFIL